VKDCVFLSQLKTLIKLITMEKHINIVAALQIGLSIFNLLIALLIFTVLKLVGGFVDEPNANTILSLVADVISIVFIVLSLPGIFAGIGLYKRKEWARILTLVLSILEVFNFPFGTAIGIYSIWALIQPENVNSFQGNSNMNLNQQL
jgi:membrane-associated protease RseP (regulator of RpoE activity)